MICKLNRRDFNMLGDAMAEVVNFHKAHTVIECTNPGEPYVNDVILQELNVKDINWFEVIGADRQ